MKGKLSAFLERIAAAESRSDLRSRVIDLRQFFAVEHIVYAALLPGGGPCAVATYPQDWVNRYIDHDYRRIDPVVLGCLRRFDTVDWKALDWSGKAARAFLAEAQMAGLGNQGVSVPLHGPMGQFAIFSLNHHASDGDWAEFRRDHLNDLLLAAYHVNTKALEVGGMPEPPILGLSPRESDALSMLALGYNRARAAEELAISEHTLRVYLENARQKLGALTTTQAVASALARGLILL